MFKKMNWCRHYTRRECLMTSAKKRTVNRRIGQEMERFNFFTRFSNWVYVQRLNPKSNPSENLHKVCRDLGNGKS